jgi:hypothetical protein
MPSFISRMKKLFKKITRIIQKEGGTVLPGLVNKEGKYGKSTISGISL